MVSSALNRLAPIDFTRYIDRLTERFTGREWLFEQIDRWLKQGDEQFYLLTGEPGVGKSAIAAKLTQIRSDIAAYHFCRAGDVETVRPGRVLRSLAAQLGKTLPRYGEALAKTIDPIRLRIDVNINIESLSNSQVTGIYIENLKESDPRDELEILLRAPLAALPDLYAEHNEPLPTLKVLLIDSLDEAVTTTGRDNMATLLAALSQVDGLPSWIRFILTARRGIENSLQFKSLQLYKLEELLAQNLQDIERYVQSRVEELVVQPELKFQARLEQAELSAETLVREVKELSKGNFLYTRLLMDGIGTGELSVKNLSILPKTLNEVYQRFLRHRCPFRKWSDRYQSILGTLTVTQEAVTQKRLVKFTGVDSQQVQDAIGILQQFLDEAEDEQGQKRYAIFHQSLREYLLDRKQNQDFWCDVKEQHDIIIGCFEKESESWQDLKAIDQYGLRYLTQHLVQANRVKELHSLLALETSDQRNAWFDAKESIEDESGFLSDVSLAWSQAETASMVVEEKAEIALQCCYALMTASIHSIAENIPADLLIAAVSQKIWSPTKGLTYTAQIPDPYRRSIGLIDLLPHLPESFHEQALQKIIITIQSISNERDRTRSLISLATHLTDNLKIQAFNIAITLENQYFLIQAVTGLIPHLPDTLKEKALSTIFQLKGEYQAQALVQIAHYLPESLLSNILDATQKLKEYFRSKVLVGLAPLLPESLKKQAFEIAMSIQHEENHEHWRAQSLAALIPCLQEDLKEQALQQALKDVQDITHEASRIQLRHELESYTPGTLQETPVSNDVNEIQYSEKQTQQAPARSSESLSSPMLEEQVQQALDTALTIQDDEERTRALTELAPQLSKVLLSKALISTLAIQDKKYQVWILTKFTSYLPLQFDEQMWQLALIFVMDEIEDQNCKEQELLALVPHVPTAMHRPLLEAIRKIDSGLKILIALLPYLSVPLLSEAVEDTLNILLEDSSSQMSLETLGINQEIGEEERESYGEGGLLGPKLYLPESLKEQALNNALELQDEFQQVWMLAKLAPNLPESLQREVVIKIVSVYNRHHETETNESELTTLLPLLAIELVPHLLPIFQQEMVNVIWSNHAIRTIVIAKLASYLPNYLQQEALNTISIMEPLLQVEALLQLIPTLPKLIQEQVCENVLNIAIANQPDANNQAMRTIMFAFEVRDGYFLKQTLLKLAPYLPTTLHGRALEAALSIDSKIEKVKTLIGLAPYLGCLGKDALQQALDMAESIADDYSRARMLAELLPLMSGDKREQVLQKVLNAAEAIKDTELIQEIARQIKTFANVSSYLQVSEQEELWQKVLSTIQTIPDEENRQEMLTRIIPHLPTSLLQQALEITLNIQNHEYRIQVLKKFIPYLKNLPAEQLHPVWSQTLRFSANRTRRDLLSDIGALIPIIPTLSIEEVEATAGVIENVGRWW
ncbi:ATP-binding protein [Trichocoleus sp. DQ-A3]|uniref:ATP-binding protein n=1 Tax=Cyanophyceae TaxID=3028117 RepID=UPI00168655D6|nr:ATP-binding protein [Coleofasciculus sp. FACHB-125]MBD1898908.1 ATP-binding protein [Coleofasciculus sp. FACHB-125]